MRSCVRGGGSKGVEWGRVGSVRVGKGDGGRKCECGVGGWSSINGESFK
jgi:hypothetical protein